MSYGGYQQYGGNPYGQAEAGYGNGGSAPSGYGASSPYGGTNDQPLTAPPPIAQTYSQGSHYSQPSQVPTQQGGAPLSRNDFLERRDGAMARINHLSTSIQEIASVHQRLLTSPDSRASSQLESMVSDTQVRNTQIKDEIKFLERDAARDPSNTVKRDQIKTLKNEFKRQLEEFNKAESDYAKRYRDAIERQYRIVNPDATEQEVNEARNADWGDEGIFQQALKANRSGQASSVLGVVRARHNDIQNIEKTMVELATLFRQLDEQVVYQEQHVQDVELQTEQVNDNVKDGNVKLTNGIKSARRARKLKWWTLGVVVLIIAIIALALGIYFGTRNK